MSFKNDLGAHAERLIVDLLKRRGWAVDNVNYGSGGRVRNYEWGDLYAVSPSGMRLFLSVKGRNAIEHSSGRLIYNGSYDGKGNRMYMQAKRRLQVEGRKIDGIGWIAVAMNLDQTYQAFVGLLQQMVVTGMKGSSRDDWKWSIPMRPTDRPSYFHLASGRHCFDWSSYPGQWFNPHYRIWQETGVAPRIHIGQSRTRKRPVLPEVFPEVTSEPFAQWDVRSVFGPRSL